MNLQLYSKYSESMLIAKKASDIEYADTTTRLVETEPGLCLFTKIGRAPSWITPVHATIPYFILPGILCWYSNYPSWNSRLFSQVEGRTRLEGALKTIKIFGRVDDSRDYWFVGVGRLVSMGFHGASCYLIRFSINPVLSRNLWVEFGGYKDWLLTIGGKEFQIDSRNTVDALLSSEWGTSASDLEITRYEGDCLRAAVNEKGEAVVSYYAGGTSPEIFSGHFDTDSSWISFLRFDGDEWEVPVSTVISRESAVSIIRKYLLSGRPIGLSGAS